MKVRLKKDVNPQYVTYVLASHMIQQRIERMSVGVAQKNINLKQVGELLIPLPPIEIQNKIAEIIEMQRESVEHLESLKEQAEDTMQYIINELFSPEGDGFFPIPKQKKLDV